MSATPPRLVYTFQIVKNPSKDLAFFEKKWTYENGDWYKGSMQAGKRHGQGLYFKKSDESVFQGTWENDLLSQGMLKSKSGDVFQGHWRPVTLKFGQGCVLHGDVTLTKKDSGKVYDTVWDEGVCTNTELRQAPSDEAVPSTPNARRRQLGDSGHGSGLTHSPKGVDVKVRSTFTPPVKKLFPIQQGKPTITLLPNFSAAELKSGEKPSIEGGYTSRSAEGEKTKTSKKTAFIWFGTQDLAVGVSGMLRTKTTKFPWRDIGDVLIEVGTEAPIAKAKKKEKEEVAFREKDRDTEKKERKEKEQEAKEDPVRIEIILPDKPSGAKRMVNFGFKQMPLTAECRLCRYFESFPATLAAHRAINETKLDLIAIKIREARAKMQELKSSLNKIREKHVTERKDKIPDEPMLEEEENDDDGGDTTTDSTGDTSLEAQSASEDLADVDFTMLANEVRQLMMGDWSRFETSKHYKHLLGDFLKQTKMSKLIAQKLLASQSAEDMMARQRIRKEEKKIEMWEEEAMTKNFHPGTLVQQTVGLKNGLLKQVALQQAEHNRAVTAKQEEKARAAEKEAKRFQFHVTKVEQALAKMTEVFVEIFKNLHLPELQEWQGEAPDDIDIAPPAPPSEEELEATVIPEPAPEEAVLVPEEAGEAELMSTDGVIGGEGVGSVGSGEGEGPLAGGGGGGGEGEIGEGGETPKPASAVLEKKKKKLVVVEREDGALKSNMTLGALLKSEKGIDYFRQFAVESLNVENLQFYLRYMGFQSMNDRTSRRKEALAIYDTFIKVGSEMEINVSDEMRKHYNAIFTKAAKLS